MANGQQDYHFRQQDQDFASIEGWIRLNEDRLHFEYDRYYRLRNFQTIFFLFYTAIGAFLHRLIAFTVEDGIYSELFMISFILFGLAFLTFIGWTIELVRPKRIAFIDRPRVFYEEYYNLYLEKAEKGELDLEGSEDEIPELLKENYLSQLEYAVEENQNKNDLVNVRNRETLMVGIVTLIFYLASLVSMEIVEGQNASLKEPTKDLEHEQRKERKLQEAKSP